MHHESECLGPGGSILPREFGGDIVAFTDDDAIADVYWLAEILRGYAARPSVGCVTGVILPAELRTQAQDWFEQFGGLSKGRGFEREIFEPGHPQSPLFPFPPFVPVFVPPLSFPEHQDS